MDTLLQKQFNEKDVKRMRSLITKDYNKSISTQVGYTKQTTQHNEGDVWEEDDKVWTIRNGIKMTVPKSNNLRHLVVMPLVCPSCNKPMASTQSNKDMYNAHGKCLDCVIEFETKLKAEGKFDEYKQQILQKALDQYINNIEQEFEEFINETDTNVTEAGDVERWVGGENKENIKKQVHEYINQLKSIDIP